MTSSPKSSRSYYLENRERIIARTRAWQQANPDKVRRYRAAYGQDGHLRRAHGIRMADRELAILAQDGLCCYCERPLPSDQRHIHVDHDHSCCGPQRSCPSCRRGIACASCNTLVGLADDDPDRLELIAANLRILAAAARERIEAKPVQQSLLEVG